MSPARLILVAALATGCHGALAQSAVPPASVVQQLAPQLIVFSGSDANFQSLVNGLSQGTPVQLTTTLPNGFVQTVTFTPNAALAPLQIAQVLETARQQLIGLGIGTPTGEQLGFTLMGGVVPTALGGTQVPGVLTSGFNPANPPSPAAQLQQQNSAGGATSATPTASAVPSLTNRVNVQLTPGLAPVATPGALLPPRQTSDSTIAPGTTSRSPTLPAAPTLPGAAAAATPPTPERATQAQRPNNMGH
jgi:hypothetical protein